ncbi:MAG: methyltransferase domain-containing protein [Myxococcales bacterium FL481]|nr:MAG: methyltransferase domain-containing protein [Myxococcales bacterium FL481]
MTSSYTARDERYDAMHYRRCGRSGLRLPPLSLGMWQNFGGIDPFDEVRAKVLHAFDLGVTHFDFGNNYGKPPGSAEAVFGRLLRSDLRSHRDELIVSTKAGYRMWPGPYGEFGSRKYLISSLDQSLQRLGLDYVDIFYSHRFDPHTPLEETMGALEQIVRRGKALYVGISSYSAEMTIKAVSLLRDVGIPCLVHQSSYSMVNRWPEERLFDELDAAGVGFIAFTPLAQGLLSDKYTGGVPAGSRAAQPGSTIPASQYHEGLRRSIAGLAEIARRRGQTLAQMAIAWVLRRPQVTSALVGVRTLAQIDENVAATTNLSFSEDELAAIDRFATDQGINLWEESSSHRGESLPPRRRTQTSPPSLPDASATRKRPVEPVVRERCVLCGASHLDALTTFPDFPVYVGCANQPCEDDVAMDMRWTICRACGTIQLDRLVPLSLLYQDGHNEAVGELWNRHHRRFAEFVLRHGGTQRLEIGGANGVLARMVRERDQTGRWLIVEPNPRPTAAIPNTEIQRTLFDEAYEAPFPIDTVVHSHVMEHWYDPIQTLGRISRLLPVSGRMVFSIPPMKAMLEAKHTNCLNFEHSYYLSEAAAEAVVDACGFAILAKEHFDPVGIFYACEKRGEGARRPVFDHLDENRSLFDAFLGHHRALVDQLQARLESHDGPAYIFGAHIFTQYLLAFGLREDRFEAVLDNGPGKIGKRLYGTRLWTQSPKVLAGQDNAMVVLKAGAYDSEIRTDIHENINPNVTFI